MRILSRLDDPTTCTTTTVADGATYRCTKLPDHGGEHLWWLVMDAVVDDTCTEPDRSWHSVSDPERTCVHDETAWVETCASRIRVRLYEMGVRDDQEALF